MYTLESKIGNLTERKPLQIISAKSGLIAVTLGLILAFSAAASTQRSEEIGPADGWYTGTIETAYGLRTVSYQILKGSDYGLAEDVAVFEGDIVLPNILPPDHQFAKSAGRVDTKFRWPNGFVPFEIDSRYNADEVQIINNALAHWNANTPYWFHPRNGESDFIRFVKANVCASIGVGRQGGQQIINLDATNCGTGSTIHEIGHAIGLWHEQSRADRDKFVTINWNNIQQGMESQFLTYIQSNQDGRDMFDFDFNSIMLYPSNAFAKTVNNVPGGVPVGPTMTKKDGTTFNAQRIGLSQGDIAGAVRELTNTQPQQTFQLINLNSGKCLDVADWSRSNGAAVNQFNCSGGANQRWYLWTVPGTNSSLIINDWSGQCLDIPGGSLADGAQLQQFSCHGYGDQQFNSAFNFFTVGYRFQNANSLKCLDVPNGSTASGVRVQQFTCHSGLNQQWWMVP